MRHIRRHLEALPAPAPLPRPVLAAVSNDEQLEAMAMFIMTTGRDTLLRLRTVEHDDDALSALLRSLTGRELSGADVCAGAHDRDAFISRMIAYEEGRRAGVFEVTGIDEGGAA